MESRFGAKAFAFFLFPLMVLPFARFGATDNSATSRAGSLSEIAHMQIARASHSSTLLPDGKILIAGVVIGGTSLAGGSGTIIGAALGVLIITTIDSGLVFYGVNLNYSEFVTGLVIVGAIALDRIVKRRRAQ